jgi:alpha-ketoglutarate-dependent taurine dioxygenase
VNHTISYDSFMHDDSGLKTALSLLHYYGLFFVDKVPSDEESVAKLAERIGPIRNTFYGRTWDVRSKPEAENVAYTNQHLGFHMDLLYMHESPGIQLLHCMENTCEGGESAFVDTFRAALQFHQKHLSGAGSRALSQDFIKYGYDKGGNTFSARKPVFELVLDKFFSKQYFDGAKWVQAPPLMQRLRRVFWSPPFISAEVTRGTIKETKYDKLQNQPTFIQKCRKDFADILEDKRLRFETKLPPGTCAIFDNLRVVHARKAFDTSSGYRWLRGAYVDFQDFHSKALACGLGIKDTVDLEQHQKLGAEAETAAATIASKKKRADPPLEIKGGRQLIRKHFTGPGLDSGKHKAELNNNDLSKDSL